MIPRISSEYRFVRARACFAAKQSASAQFKDLKILKSLVAALVNCLKDDKELPVKVEAATAIQTLISEQESKGNFFNLKKILKYTISITLDKTVCTRYSCPRYAINSFNSY